jgi:predicted GIY-YIG superfamily endonuclease
MAFTRKAIWPCGRFVYDGVLQANNIQSEKRLKKRNRAWQISLIEKINLNWIDLFSGIASP